ncbi:hypothetical protein RGQ29_021148 [Quercus rubra]|uniref:RRM domain-containing protein n=1 Tax=Quercus rubra TaxID=3512 RepID=A0AAN7FID0_QUERU|nr:hypothetical protein RGQ29_021148 [Quercus rubra]
MAAKTVSLPLQPLPLPHSQPPPGFVNSQCASLYVGDLDPQVTESDLVKLFSTVGPIASVRLCRDISSQKSLRYAYVNFVHHYHASMALARLNHTYLKGFPMRIMWCQRDPLSRKTGYGNLFVKNLPPSVNSLQLHSLFSRFGTILSCKVAEENGKSKGFGFVQFDTEESATSALYALHDTVIDEKKLYVSKFMKKSERMAAQEELNFTNLYVKNLSEDTTEELLRDQFSKFGKVSSVAIMKDNQGKSRGFGFVNFESSEDAKNAVGALNGAFIGSKYLFVGRAQRKTEREELLKREYMERCNYTNEQLKASNLFVNNLSTSVDDNKLKKHFSTCGQLTSVKVMCLDNGISKGFGFVRFSNPEDAMKALHTLNGTTLEGKTLYVAIAQRKEDRIRTLQNHYAQFSPPETFYNCNWNVHPFFYHFPPCPSSNQLLSQPIMYQDCQQYPLVTQTYHDRFSIFVPNRQKEWDNTRDQLLKNNGTPGGLKLDSRKKGNKRSGPGESTYTGSAGAKGGAHTAGTSPGKSRRNLEKVLAENLQITGMLLENNSSDITKLLNPPNALGCSSFGGK